MQDKANKIINFLGKLKRKYRTANLASEQNTPFKILISTILSARTRDETTARVCQVLFGRYPNPEKLSKARLNDIKRVIRRIGFYNQKAKNIIRTAKIIQEKYKGRVPETMAELLALPGVGRKTANIVLAYAFNKPAIAVDTHVHKISQEFFKTRKPEQTEKKLMSLLPRKHWKDINRYFVTYGKDKNKNL